MPGSRLNDTERRLDAWWRQDNFDSPVLRRVSVEGETGLRGIRKLEVTFDYPLTALCGRNGNGKTTLLALAALAFGGASGHVPRGAIRSPRRGEDFTYYTFSDFFFRGTGDPNLMGITITWEYAGRLRRQDGRPAVTPILVRKRSEKWMHYERRPSKPVHYIGVSRAIPAAEQRVLRAHFGAAARRLERTPLTDLYRERLSEIMGRDYQGAEVMSAQRHSLRSCGSGGAAYTSFNMGAGEDILIELLHVLQEAPTGSMIVIEEIELGLHPEALVRLAGHLQDIMFEKRLQVVVSTHSQHFLDAIPRQARLLIQRDGDVHQTIREPTARFATSVMAGRADPELVIYCEDGFAESVIGGSLTPEVRRRCRIIAIGSKSELGRQARFHQRGGFGQLLFLVWDGDVSEAELRRLLQQSGAATDDLSWFRLPGGIAPERWILELLSTEEGRSLLADELQTSVPQATQLLVELRALRDVHDVVPELGRKVHLRNDEAERALIMSARRLDTRPLEPIRQAIEAVLARQLVQDPSADAEQPVQAA